MSPVPSGLAGFIERFAGELRFPVLFWFTAVLFLIDLVVPDLLPFADEILLGLAALVLAAWKRRREPPPGAPPGGGKVPEDGVIDVTPEP